MAVATACVRVPTFWIRNPLRRRRDPESPFRSDPQERHSHVRKDARPASRVKASGGKRFKSRGSHEHGKGGGGYVYLDSPAWGVGCLRASAGARGIQVGENGAGARRSRRVRRPFPLRLPRSASPQHLHPVQSEPGTSCPSSTAIGAAKAASEAPGSSGEGGDSSHPDRFGSGSGHRRSPRPRSPEAARPEGERSRIGSGRLSSLYPRLYESAISMGHMEYGFHFSLHAIYTAIETFPCAAEVKKHRTHKNARTQSPTTDAQAKGDVTRTTAGF
uniref:uncharacterized protein LOC114605506 n=1 Tax=Podarcis muralis TaxID=64176 RepID=UPI00109F4306|nr:uncharacterized protein LOC114605506 [Podarcis muralis]